MAAPAQNISEETLAQITKAQSAGLYESSGVYSYDLSPLVQLIPVVTPFRDAVPRVKSPDGNPYAVWRAFLDATGSQPDTAMGFDFAANEVVFNEQDFMAAYKPTGLANLVTQDAFDYAQGYADPYAVATFQTMNYVLIGDDRKQLGAQSFALPRPAVPTLTTGTAGTIGAVTPTIGVAARTGSGYYFGSGNSRGNQVTGAALTGSNNSVTATVAPVRGAACYDWFWSVNGGTNFYYYTTTTVNSCTFTQNISANNPLPSLQQCPDLSRQWLGLLPGAPGYVGPATYNGTADNGSANAADYDGFMATLSGDYNSTGQWVTAGTGTANPSVWNSLNGGPLTLSGGSVAEIENYLFLPLWHQIKASPTALMMNAQQAQEIANLILGQPSATTFLNTDQSGRISVTAGGRVGEIVNAPAGGVTVPIEVHVSLPPGKIIARMDRVPFPNANISNVLEQRCLRDTAQFDYGISRIPGTKGGGPRREFEIRSNSAFINRAPVAMGVLSEIA